MREFQIKKIEQVKGRNVYYKLIKDGVCEFDLFCAQMSTQSKFQSELRSIFTYMELTSNQIPLPATKFKDITPKISSAKQHEFKTKNLRVYTFQDKGTGKIIVCGGLKSTQQSDINHFRETIRQYFESKE